MTTAGSSRRAAFALAATPTTRFALPAELRGRSYEYSLRALDRSGNVLAEHGSDADPQLVHGPPADSALAPPAPPDRSYLLPATLGLAGLGSLIAGVVFQVERENAAQEWNGASCEQPGQTRLQQCQSVDETRQKYEHLAIGFYAAGGALLTGGLIALVAGQRKASSSARAGLLGCALAGTGLNCAGQF